MRRKFFVGFLVGICTILVVVCLVACNVDDTGIVDSRDKQIVSVYNTYVVYAEENGVTPLPYEEWLKSIKGEKGDDGRNGQNGKDGTNGLNGKDGKDGENGKDGVGIANMKIENGKLFVKYTNRENYIELGQVKGFDGKDGKDGENGKDGLNGKDGKDGENGKDGVGIKNTYIDVNGNLIIVFDDEKETEINAGQVVAPIKKLDENNKIVFDEIFTVNERTVSTKVSNDTESIYFNDYITILGGAGYSVYRDRDCENLVKSKIVDLEIGDNSFYVLEYCGECDNLYTVNIRRRPIYTVSFNTNGGSEVENQYIEEDGFAVEPVSVLPNNAATWDFDFSNPILENKEITATWHEVFHLGGWFSGQLSFTDLTDYGKTLSEITAEMFPNNLTSIDRTFAHNPTLKKISIPNGVVSITGATFASCSSLEIIILPDSLTSVGDVAFYGCYWLTKIYYKGDAKKQLDINIGEKNDGLVMATWYYYSETEPTEAGNYWHYDTDGITVLEW